MAPLPIMLQVPTDTWGWVFYAGALGVALLVLFLISVTGQLRTKYELEAWKRQTERSEAQVDTLLPAMREMTQAVKELTVAVRELMQMERERGKA